MTQSRYEKYVVRKPVPPDFGIKWGRPDLGVVAPFHFLSPSGPIKGANTMVEYTWITKDCASGVTAEKAPHKHDCTEIFVFMGTNPEDPDDLGADIEFWLGEGKETEQIKINTPAAVIVPGGLLHMPIFCRNVKRPSLRIVVGLNIGNALQNTVKYPVRGI
jgi:hypothetical protein